MGPEARCWEHRPSRPLASTIPASCLQHHNPSWSLSLSESPGLFIFPLERELSSQLGRGRSCHPPSDGWLLMTTRSPGPFSPRHKPAPKDRQSDHRESLAGEQSPCQFYTHLLSVLEHSQTPLAPGRQVSSVSAVISSHLWLAVCLSAQLAHAELLCALFWVHFTSGKSRVPSGGGRGACPAPPRGQIYPQVPSLPGTPFSPGQSRSGSYQGV